MEQSESNTARHWRVTRHIQAATEIVLACIHRVTMTSFRSTSMPAGFRRHFVGKTVGNVSYCDVAYIRFVRHLMILEKLPSIS